MRQKKDVFTEKKGGEGEALPRLGNEARRMRPKKEALTTLQ